MKKHLCALLIVALVVSLCSASFAAYTMYVNTANRQGVNMRLGPSVNMGIVTVVPYAQAVNVRQVLDGNTWAYCSYNGRNGYIMLRYLSYTNPQSGGGGTDTSLSKLFSGFRAAYYVASVTPSTPTGFVNMRWAPSMSAPVFDIYYSGSELYVLYTNGVWAQVYDPNRMAGGYMMTEFLSYEYSLGQGFGSSLN